MKLKLKRGLKLNIAGGLPANVHAEEKNVGLCAIIPDDFPGFVPKVCVRDGDAVAAGTPLLFDKRNPEVKIVSPVNGRVRAVVRGERRKIMRVELEVGETSAPAVTFSQVTDEDSARKLLAESGLLALMRQRPYDIVPAPYDTVRDIFITALDTAPLAPSAAVFSALFDKQDYEAGVALLKRITKGKVYLSHGSDWAAGDIKGAEMVEVEGPHPAGNKPQISHL